VDTIKFEKLTKSIDEKSNKTEPGSLFWDGQTQKSNRGWWYYPRSLAVEMTAYNIMSLILQDRADEAVDAVKWLARQRNSRGGFRSTQDTVVGLQALSMYGRHIGGYSTNMQLDVLANGDKVQDLSLDEDNKQILKANKLDTVPNNVEFNLKGSGCVILQTVVRYNVPESQEPASFTLETKFNDDVLKVCTAYINEIKDETDMAILEVEMLSGYKAVRPDDLLNEIEPLVKKVEVDDKENKVVLYFDKLTKQERCVNLTLKREFKVSDLKPARLTVYDYYNTEDKYETTYKLD